MIHLAEITVPTFDARIVRTTYLAEIAAPTFVVDVDSDEPVTSQQILGKLVGVAGQIDSTISPVVEAQGKALGAAASVSSSCSAVVSLSGDIRGVAGQGYGRISNLTEVLATGDLRGQAGAVNGRIDAEVLATGGLRGQAGVVSSFVNAPVEATGVALGAAGALESSVSGVVSMSADMQGVAGQVQSRVSGGENLAEGRALGQAGTVTGSVDVVVSATGAGTGAPGVVASSASPAVDAAGSALGESGSLDSVASAQVDCSGKAAGVAAILTSSVEGTVSVSGDLRGASASLSSAVEPIVEASGDARGIAGTVVSDAAATVAAEGKLEGIAGTVAGSASPSVEVLGKAAGTPGTLYGTCTVEAESEHPEFDDATATYYAVAPSGWEPDAEEEGTYSARVYSSLSAAVSDLASATHPVIYVVGEWSSNDTAGNVSIPSITASGGITIQAIGAAKGSYVFERSSANSIWVNNFAGRVHVKDLTIRWSATTGASAGGAAIYNNVNNGRMDFERCLGETSAQPSSPAAFFSTSGSATGCTLNLIASAFRGYGSTANVVASYVGNTSGSTLRLYNATIVGLAYGIYQTGAGTAIAKNVGNRASTATVGTVTQTMCSTSAPTFEADGWHLASGDTTWRAGGTALDEDAAYSFSLDIDQDSIGTWPIGCDA